MSSDGMELGKRLSGAVWFIADRSSLDPYSGARIPSDDQRTRYFADLACGHGFFLNALFADLKKKSILGVRGADRWNAASYPVAIGASIRYLVDATNNPCLIEGEVGQYLSTKLDMSCPGAGEFLTSGNFEQGQFMRSFNLDIAAEKAARLLLGQAQKTGVKLKLNGEELVRDVVLLIMGTDLALDHSLRILPGISLEETLLPLTKT